MMGMSTLTHFILRLRILFQIRCRYLSLDHCQSRRKLPQCKPFNKFLKLSRLKKMVLLVVSHEAKPDDENVPLKFQTQLEKFQDIMPDEIPKQLPLMQGVQHPIDLIPKSSLLNFPHYSTSPFANEELNSQIKLLLDSGFIRESVSPCAMPALLMPKRDNT